MIRRTLAGLGASLGAALCIALPATAQSFTHTHGASGSHSHDTTIRTTSGSCCYVNTCSHGHSYGTHHGPHHRQGHHKKKHHDHSSHSLQGAPVVTRTYTRTYVHPHKETRVYSRTVPGHVTHRSHSHRTYSYRGHGHRAHGHDHRSHGHHHGHRHGHTHKDKTHGPYGMSHDERLQYDYAYDGERHDDRDRAWAHYDKRWRSRTNDKRH